MTASVRAVLFDLDGTLLDSIRLILDSYHHALAANNLPARSDDDWLAGIGTSLRSQLKHWAHDPPLYEALLASYRDFNLAHHDTRVTAYPGAVETVQEIRRLGYRTALVTSKLRTGALRGLNVLGLSEVIEIVVAADDVTNPKPDPEPVLKAATTLGVEPSSCLFVGDSVHDIEAGKAAGSLTAAALWGPFPRTTLEASAPHYWLNGPGELIDLLARQSRADN